MLTHSVNDIKTFSHCFWLSGWERQKRNNPICFSYRPKRPQHEISLNLSSHTLSAVGLNSSLGFSMIEIMVSSAIASIMLLVISSLFVTFQQHSIEREHHLRLLHTGFEIIHNMSNEIKKAGFNGMHNSLAQFSALQQPIYFTQDAISVVSQETSGNSYSTVFFKYEKQQLKICRMEKFSQPPELEACNVFYTLTDDKRLSVIQFSIQKTSLTQPPLQHALAIHFTLRDRLTKEQQAYQFIVTIRNIDPMPFPEVNSLMFTSMQRERLYG